MIPNFLNEFKDKLEKFKLESIKIKATPISENENPTFTQSKFLGKPYLPIGFEYPKDKKGNPMILLAQINFAETPQIENYPTDGILQFFISSTEWYDMEDYKVLFHEIIENEYQTDFSFLTEKLYEESPIYCEHKLAFEKTIEYGGYEDFRFNDQIDFNGKDYFDFQEELTKEQAKEMDSFLDGTGHKIGGYAYFTQSDPRDYAKNKKNEILLLQIDTDEQIMFGDVGVGNFFINPKSLKEKDFNQAWFNWDCC
ncbi:Uncharacterized protein YwqG [Paenimyroides aquimaris]|uniref:Uncharacterized protein YwqG n=1 Tax=Paenimyroides marinum TaxID=1159016 RepID=A0A1H6K2Q0_9FLAO|nr:DUF1963 domain-containing protein [Paenimyroides aquimaris]SEH65801.1 Uncharacterized protein YwqG [Paenimyroides aquimaris]